MLSKPSTLTNLFVHPVRDIPRTLDGSIFLDFDPILFHHCVRWICDGIIPRVTDSAEEKKLIELANTLKLPDLAKDITRPWKEKISPSQFSKLGICKTAVSCDLRLLQLQGFNFTDWNLSGADISQVNLAKAKFCKANMCDANLAGSDLSFADLTGSILISTDLKQAILEKAKLGCADLSSADFSYAQLANQNLAHANLFRTKFVKAILQDADLAGAILERADLSGANLQGANLCGANLFCAILSGADLSGANFSGANVSYANLVGVKLEGTIFAGADFTKTILFAQPETGPEERDLLVPIIEKQLKEGDKWCVISAQWLRDWKNYVQFEVTILKGKILLIFQNAVNGDKPGQINNSPLVDPDAKSDNLVILKQGLKEKDNFSLIPIEAWHILFNWLATSPKEY